MLEPFDYDRWLATDPEDLAEKPHPEDCIFSNGRWVYVGDEI